MKNKRKKKTFQGSIKTLIYHVRQVWIIYQRQNPVHFGNELEIISLQSAITQLNISFR